jgi:hypothetical protein
LRLRNTTIMGSILLGMTGAAFSATTVVFGGAPLLALLRGAPRIAFFLAGLVGAAGFAAMGAFDRAILWVATWALIFTYNFLISRGLSIWSAGLTATAFVTGTIVTAFGVWCLKLGINPSAILSQNLNEYMDLAASQGAVLSMDREMILKLWPSALVIMTAVTLWLAVISERGMRRLASLNQVSTQEIPRLFRVPDFLIWPGILCLAGAFLAKSLPLVDIISRNGLNIFVLLYFFQGMAVVAIAMDRLRAGPFFRTFSYVLLVTYLFLAVSLLGFADFWMDLRNKLSKKSHEIV